MPRVKNLILNQPQAVYLISFSASLAGLEPCLQRPWPRQSRSWPQKAIGWETTIYTPPPRPISRNRPPSRKNVPGKNSFARVWCIDFVFLKSGNSIHHRARKLQRPTIIGSPTESRIPLGAVVVYRKSVRSKADFAFVAPAARLLSLEAFWVGLGIPFKGLLSRSVTGGLYRPFKGSIGNIGRHIFI